MDVTDGWVIGGWLTGGYGRLIDEWLIGGLVVDRCVISGWIMDVWLDGQ